MYDTIVVGAGSAGATLAARLSEDPSRTVLLLEAGPDYRSADTIADIRSVEPGAVQVTQTLKDTHTWPELMARRTSVQEPAVYFRGRGVGGSSSINGMFAIRATVDDFDGWAKAGCTGWSHDELLPLLTAMEDDVDFGSEPHHGTGGPIPVMRPAREDFSQLDAAVTDALIGLGHAWAPDHNAPGATGVSPYAYNARDGRRVSTNDAYLEPARDRANLTILGGAHVDRVLIVDGRVVGVRATVDGELRELTAPEVVLSAGAIHSPAILQRSGVGPSALLRGLGIDVVSDLPVGLGLQEHAGLALMVILHEPLDYGTLPHRGQVCARFDTGVGDEPNDGMLAVVGALGIGVPMAGFVGWVNRADSTGSVQITSTDPTADPAVEFNLLSAPTDLQRCRAIYEQMREVALQPELQKIAATMGFGPTLISPDVVLSDSEFTDWALGTVMDTVHGTSTCAMGSVVDPEGRVLGVEGLRVADASILPWTTRANTNLTSILVGEKIASVMKENAS